MKWKTFIDFGKWWFLVHNLGGFETQARLEDKSVTCNLSKDQIKRMMSGNLCVGYNYKDSQ